MQRLACLEAEELGDMCLPLPNQAERTLATGEHLGIMWQIVPNHIGYRCGYVRVGPDHPWFGKKYSDVGADCHGGLTFAEAGTACPTHDEQAEWWLGFDCCHAGDAPDLTLIDEAGVREHYSTPSSAYFMHGTIKDTAYVEAECRSLCEQAQAAMRCTA